MNAIKLFLAPYWAAIAPYWLLIKWAGLVVLVLTSFIGGCQYHEGKTEGKAAKETVKIVYKQGKVTERVVTKYLDRVRTIRIAGDQIIKEVPVYVTPENDAACVINGGFVRLWNDANQGAVSDPAGGADAAPSAVELSEVGRQKAVEAKLHRETEAQLIALQEWVRVQSKVK